MTEEKKALIPYDSEQSITVIEDTAIQVVQARDYGAALALASESADRESVGDVFKVYHTEQCSKNTRDRQINDLACFSRFLAQLRTPVHIPAQDLYHEALAWAGISHGLVRRFVEWMTDQGYATGTINGRLFTVRKYCQLAGPQPKGAGVLTEEQVDAILTVKGRNAKQRANIDEERETLGQAQRIGKKKAHPIDITTQQALTLKKTSGSAARMKEALSATDALKLGLMIEHALRVSEVVALNLENFNLNEGTVTFWRPKTHTTETHELHTFTRRAVEHYLQQARDHGRTSGPLFLGYKDKRLTARAINERVALLGRSIGVQGRLSPHDLRHFWTWDAFRNGNQLDQIVSGGGWSNPLMAIGYAKRRGIANKNIKISEE